MANVSEERMREYLKGFHAEYRKAAEGQVPADLRRHLERYPHLSSGIIGYVSTQFGAGFEYDRSRPGEIAIVRGSARVEDLFWKAPASLRRRMTFILAGQTTSVHGGGFNGGYPVRLASANSSVRLVDVSADAPGWSRYVSYAELLGDRSAENWSSEQAVRRALSEILQAVVDLRQLEDRNLSLDAFLNRFRQRKVLLLGDFNRVWLFRDEWHLPVRQGFFGLGTVA